MDHSMVTCSRCDEVYSAKSRFCSRCGKKNEVLISQNQSVYSGSSRSNNRLVNQIVSQDQSPYSVRADSNRTRTSAHSSSKQIYNLLEILLPIVTGLIIFLPWIKINYLDEISSGLSFIYGTGDIPSSFSLFGLREMMNSLANIGSIFGSSEEVMGVRFFASGFTLVGILFLGLNLLVSFLAYKKFTKKSIVATVMVVLNTLLVLSIGIALKLMNDEMGKSVLALSFAPIFVIIFSLIHRFFIMRKVNQLQ